MFLRTLLTYYLENRVILVIQFLLKKNILSFNHECSKVVSIILPNPLISSFIESHTNLLVRYFLLRADIPNSSTCKDFLTSLHLYLSPISRVSPKVLPLLEVPVLQLDAYAMVITSSPVTSHFHICS